MLFVAIRFIYSYYYVEHGYTIIQQEHNQHRFINLTLVLFQTGLRV